MVQSVMEISNLVQVVEGGGVIAPLANPLTVALVVCMPDDGG